MTLRNDATGYGAMAKTLHWASGLFVVIAWLLGTFIDDLPKAMEPRILFTHMTLGLAILALLCLRLGWRLVDPQRGSDPGIGPWAERLSTAMQWLLYALLVAGPVSGIVLEFARGQSVPVFGLFEIA